VLADCFTEHLTCGHSGRCTVRKPLKRIHEGILRLLNSVSIKDMLDPDDGEVSVPPSLVALQTAPSPTSSLRK
jgi:DNA-binding IscR family transcriptional regulator